MTARTLAILCSATLAGMSQITTGPDPREIPIPRIQTKVATMPDVDQLPVRSQMPDVLVMQDGAKVTTKQQWMKRRAEMRRILGYYAVGQMPPPPGNVKGREVASELVLEGQVRYRQVHLTFGPASALSLNIGIFTPVQGGPFPAIILQTGSVPGAPVLPRLPPGANQGRGQDVLLIVGPEHPVAAVPKNNGPVQTASMLATQRAPMSSKEAMRWWFSIRTIAPRTPRCAIPMAAGHSATRASSPLIRITIGASLRDGPGALRASPIIWNTIALSTKQN